MVVPAPLVHVTLTVPLPLSAVEALTETGSYAPKPTGAVEIVKFADTEAVTDRFEVALPALAPSSRIRRAMRYIIASEIAVVHTSAYPRVSKCNSSPPGACTTTRPAITEATPPATCCSEELTDMYAPRSAARGSADTRADA